MKNLKELVKATRSYRSFKSGIAVPRAELEDMIDTAHFACAAMNRQTLKYRIVDDAEERVRLLGVTRWAGALKGIHLPPVSHEPTAYIVICHDENVAPFKPIFLNDVGICAELIMLSAAEKGYGGCIIGSASESAVKEVLGLPDNLLPKLIIALGIPDETVVLTEAKGDDTAYFRDENNVHYVPKRPLSDIILKS